MDSYNEENETELKSDAKDVLNVCCTGKNLQCDRKKKKSAANSKVFCVCMLCTLVSPRVCRSYPGFWRG